MPNSPRITVYIASHNYGPYLAQAIESVLRQTYQDWELLVIDDGSSDNTREVMEVYRGDSRVRLFTTAGIGLHGVCNLALREARGTYIVRLDGDDIFEENILLVLGHFLDNNSEVALVFSDFYWIDEDGKVLSMESRNKLYENNHVFDSAPNGACFLARRQSLLDVGGYRDDLLAQDGYYIWTKLQERFKCANIGLPLYYYRKHGSNLTRNENRILDARRQIKREGTMSLLDAVRPIIVTIPCRRNYDYFTDAWARKLSGQSLLGRALSTVLKSKLFDHIVVTSDSIECADVVSSFTDDRLSFVPRQQRDTIRSSPLAPTMEKVARMFDPEMKGISLLTYYQTPFITHETLEEAIHTLVIGDADCSIAVEEITRPAFVRSRFGLTPINAMHGIATDFTRVYVDARTVQATRNRNLVSGSMTGPKVVNLVVSPRETFYVDSEHTYQIACVMADQSAPAVDPTPEKTQVTTP